MRQISPVLEERLTLHNQTIENNADPRVSVQITRARSAVMDSTYWTVETIRTKAGIGDIAVAPRRQRPYGRPDRIYEIHVDNGIVKTTLREYPDRLKDGWQPQFDVGPGSSVSIAFDGEWKLWRGKWRFQSDEKPWIIWVDDTGKLWAQHWDDALTKQELATGVVKVRSIKGWKNVNIATSDQGIVAGYIKADGNVYYRNYCQQADDSVVFEIERQVTDFTGTAVNLNLFLTNDYRFGFAIQDNANNVHWLITDRNWAGMAIGREQIEVKATAQVDFIPVTYHNTFEDEHITVGVEAIVEMLFGRTDNTLISLMNEPMQRLDDDNEPYDDWGFKVGLVINFPTETLPVVIMKDATTLSTFTLAATTMISDTEFELTIDDTVHEFGINNVEGNIQVSITGMTNEAGYDYETIVQEFTPINLVPSFIPLPEVEVIWNE